MFPPLTMKTPAAMHRRVGRARLAWVGVSAFTLMELLVVVALVGILATAIGVSLANGSNGPSLDGAQRNLMAMLQAAKSTAELNGVPARFIVYSDQNSGDSSTSTLTNGRKLRFMGVIVQAKDPVTGVPLQNTWQAVNSGAYLPGGVYFMPQNSGTFAKNVPSGMSSVLTQGTALGPAIGTMQLPYPVTQARELDANSEYYYFIEFSPNGFLSNPQTPQANVVLAAANLLSDSQIDFQGSLNRMVSGVQVRLFGGIVPFRERRDITGVQ